MLSHVIHEHMVIALCKMSFSHEESKDLPDKPFQPQHYSFPPCSSGKAQPENSGGGGGGGFQASWFHPYHGFIIMQLRVFFKEQFQGGGANQCFKK